MEKTDTLSLPWFTTYKYRPKGSVATDCGFVLPAKGNGEPVIPAKLPVVPLSVNADRLFVPLFPTKRNRPRGSADNATGPVPGATGKGEPVISINDPVAGVIPKEDTVLSPAFATYAKVGVGMTAAVPLTNAKAAGPSLMALVPTGVSWPVTGSMEKKDTRFNVLSVAYNVLPAGSILIN
jgi:hypothetical protein